MFNVQILFCSLFSDFFQCNENISLNSGNDPRTKWMYRSFVIKKKDESNLEKIKSILQETSEYRARVIRNVSTDFLEDFPFFFLVPELVRRVERNQKNQIMNFFSSTDPL